MGPRRLRVMCLVLARRQWCLLRVPRMRVGVLPLYGPSKVFRRLVHVTGLLGCHGVPPTVLRGPSLHLRPSPPSRWREVMLVAHLHQRMHRALTVGVLARMPLYGLCVWTELGCSLLPVVATRGRILRLGAVAVLAAVRQWVQHAMW